MSDEEKNKLNCLIFELAKGDNQALDGIYVIAAKRMTAIAYAITGDKFSAEDVVSESFIKILKSAKAYRRFDEPMAWISKIVRNTALDMLRVRKRRMEIDIDKIFSIADGGFSLEKRAEALELKNALNKLSDDEKQAMICRYYLDMTVREIARRMSLSVSAAERTIKRAELNLKKLLLKD